MAREAEPTPLSRSFVQEARERLGGFTDTSRAAEEGSRGLGSRHNLLLRLLFVQMALQTEKIYLWIKNAFHSRYRYRRK